MIGTIAAVALVATSFVGTPDSAERTWHHTKPSRGIHADVVKEAAQIPKKHRSWAMCVSKRESHHNYRARNPRSSAAGRWQFLDTAWRQGLSHMVRDRLVEHGMPKQQAKKVRAYLADRNIAKWPGPYQDIGFNEVVARGGKHHWAGPGC